jgi:hypothetical protein
VDFAAEGVFEIVTTRRTLTREPPDASFEGNPGKAGAFDPYPEHAAAAAANITVKNRRSNAEKKRRISRVSADRGKSTI